MIDITKHRDEMGAKTVNEVAEAMMLVASERKDILMCFIDGVPLIAFPHTTLKDMLDAWLYVKRENGLWPLKNYLC